MGTVSDVIGIALSFRDYARRHDGSAMAWHRRGTAVVAIQGIADVELDQMATACVHRLKADGAELVIQIRGNVPVPEGKKLGTSLAFGSIIHERLTKRLLMMLPEGAYVLSTISKSTNAFESVFTGPVGPRSDREAVWQRAVEVGADSKICHVVWSEAELVELCDEYRALSERGGDEDPGEAWKSG